MGTGWFCLVVEIHLGGSATNSATLSSFYIYTPVIKAGLATDADKTGKTSLANIQTYLLLLHIYIKKKLLSHLSHNVLFLYFQ